MSILEIKCRADLSALDFAEIAELSAALATLEAFAEIGKIEFYRSGAAGRKAARADALPADERTTRRAMQPAPQTLLAILKDAAEPLTVAELVALSGLVENSIRPHLVALEAAGMAARSGKRGTGTKNATIWVALP